MIVKTKKTVHLWIVESNSYLYCDDIVRENQAYFISRESTDMDPSYHETIQSEDQSY